MELDLGVLRSAERKHLLDDLAKALSENANIAGAEGDAALEMVLRSVVVAMSSAIEDLAENDLSLAEGASARAIELIAVLHRRHPEYANRGLLH